MCLIYPQSLWLLHSLCLPLILVFRVPEGGLKQEILGILNGVFGPCRYSVNSLTVLLGNATLEMREVLNWQRGVSGVLRENQGPHAEIIFFALV